MVDVDEPWIEQREIAIRYGSSRRPIREFHLNVGSMSITVWDQGATLVAAEIPGGTNLIQPRDPEADYCAVDRGGFMGVTIGRYANRIANSRFQLDGAEHQLSTNDGPHTLHGGAAGFDCRVWSAEPVALADRVGVRFGLTSPDGDGGFPGTLNVVVTQWLTTANQVIFEYEAVTDAPTVISLTNHAYWNLGGGGTIVDHQLQIDADRYLASDAELLPTSMETVAGTRYDLRTEQMLSGERFGAGYDTCYVLNAGGPAAVLSHEPSGRTMKIETDQPGLQVYTANALNPPHRGVALEAQALPNSPNRRDFPSTILRPGETYRQRTTHTFDL